MHKDPDISIVYNCNRNCNEVSLNMLLGVQCTMYTVYCTVYSVGWVSGINVIVDNELSMIRQQ